MSLSDRERLLRAYRAAIQNYHDASAGFDETIFRDSLQRTERARSQVETARAALFRHENLPLDSGGVKAGETSRSAAPGSTVPLFNVDTERWVLFEIGECGSPPEGALAYAPQPEHQRGEWIAEVEEMSHRERRNVKLYYTEAGLAILREAGLEM